MFEKQIERGVAYLDKRFGRQEWIKRTNLDTLKLDHCTTCVLGQVCGDFRNEVELYEAFESGYPGKRKSTRWAAIHGFYISKAQEQRGTNAGLFYDRGYSILTAEWKAKITELRAAPILSPIQLSPVEVNEPVPVKSV